MATWAGIIVNPPFAKILFSKVPDLRTHTEGKTVYDRGIPEEKLHIDIRWTMLMVNVSDEKHSSWLFRSFTQISLELSWLWLCSSPRRF